MDSLSGKYIWIIGASSGIGAALAKELATHGAHLALSARREEKLQDLHKNLAGTRHLIAPLDIADPQSTTHAQQTILKQFPHIDSVLFLAAIYGPHDGRKKNLDFIYDMITVNLGGAFNLIDSIQPQFEKQNSGQLVLCASVAGYRGLPGGQPYCATKAALINLGESLKIEWEPKNIDVKIICPGFVQTPLTDKNDFPMPMMVTAEQAARHIAKGLTRKNFEIHFPKRFTLIMKTLRLIPNTLYFIIARKILKHCL